MGKKKKKKNVAAADGKNVNLPNNQDNVTYIDVHVDGACAGNPGKMGIGGIVTMGSEKRTFSEPAGHGTNNEAEYLAVLKALEIVKERVGSGPVPESIRVYSDSQLVVNQLNGTYGINYPHLATLNGRVRKLIKQIPYRIIFHWIPRERNSAADALASKAADMPQAAIRGNEVVTWDADGFKPDPDKLEQLPKLKEDCEYQLTRLVGLGPRARFKEFADLKTGGIDGYSRTKIEKLTEYVIVRFGEESVTWLEEVTGGFDTDYGKTALRWVSRGLPPDMALKKVSVDMEIRANMRK